MIRLGCYSKPVIDFFTKIEQERIALNSSWLDTFFQSHLSIGIYYANAEKVTGTINVHNRWSLIAKLNVCQSGSINTAGDG